VATLSCCRFKEFEDLSEHLERKRCQQTRRTRQSTKQAIFRTVCAEGLVLLAIYVGHGLIDPLTPSRMTHSDESYPKKCRLPAQRRRQATSLVSLVHNRVHGLCGCTVRLGRAKSDRTRDRCMAVA